MNTDEEWNALLRETHGKARLVAAAPGRTTDCCFNGIYFPVGRALVTVAGMNLTYNAVAGRNRLSGRQEQRGSKMGLSGTGGMLFGGLFVAVGTMIMLVGLKILPVDPSSVKAPYWVLTAVGSAFAAGGLLICSMALRQISADRRCKQAQRLHPDEPALADYGWNPRGFEATRWKDAMKALMGATVFTVFLLPFNWIALTHKQVMVWIVIGILDVGSLFFWRQAILLIGRALKFGDSRIVFSQFPYRRGEPVVIQWVPPHGIGQVTKGEFTLRCVEEWWEVTGTGKEKSKSLVQEEIWRGTWSMPQGDLVRGGGAMELQYTPKGKGRSTRLNSDRPVFWEFEVKLDLAGFDFEQIYLVPVYGSLESADAEHEL